MTQIFVYGTLKDFATRVSVLGHEVPHHLDSLSNYEIKPHSVFLIYPTIEKCEGKGVDGCLLKVKDDEIPKLDRYESGLYKKIEVKLDSGTIAFAYIENKDLSE